MLSADSRNVRLLRLLLTLAFCGVSIFRFALEANAQKKFTPKDTGKADVGATKTTASKRGTRTRPRQTSPNTVKTEASVESDKFLNLGDEFLKKDKLNAAEAAYKEAVNLWSGNGEALLELGYLYIDRKPQEVGAILSRLRGVNSGLAGLLQAEITKSKQQRDH